MADEWITYEELGARLGVSTQAARAHVRRHNWPRRTPNMHGARALVQVPGHVIVQPRAPLNGVRTPDVHPNGADLHVQPDARLAGAIRALESAVDGLREANADLQRRLDTERVRAERAELRVAELLRPWWRRYFRW